MNSDERTQDLPSEDGIPGMSGTTSPSKFLTRSEDHRDGPRSSWDTRALAHLKDHLQSEKAALEAYAEVRSDATGAVAYLIDMILADEVRHHQLFAELANAIAPSGRAVAGASAVPLPTKIDDEKRVPMLVRTRELLDAERQDERELKDLQHELRPVRSETIWPLLVEMMALDTDKHIKMLHRVEQLLSS